MPKKSQDQNRLDRIIAESRQQRELREQSYRQQALKLFPWVCGRCSREFNRSNLQELTVHHRDHNHDNNPADGSNWELLCIYCHENEHARLLDAAPNNGVANKPKQGSVSTHKPFSELDKLLHGK